MPILDSTVTCPACTHEEKVRMPIDACQLIYKCPNCGSKLTPRDGDCCVFCSYGDVKCPPMQE